METFFKGLFEYSHHCNQQLFELISNHPDQTSQKAMELYNHIVNAHHIWNNRIEHRQPVFGVWELHPVMDLKAIDRANYAHTLAILNKHALSKIIHYSNSKGQTFSNNIGDILFHIINHSTYHRGQIATELKQQGLEPLVADYIFYKR